MDTLTARVRPATMPATIRSRMFRSPDCLRFRPSNAWMGILAPREQGRQSLRGRGHGQQATGQGGGSVHDRRLDRMVGGLLLAEPRPIRTEWFPYRVVCGLGVGEQRWLRFTVQPPPFQRLVGGAVRNR